MRPLLGKSYAEAAADHFVIGEDSGNGLNRAGRQGAIGVQEKQRVATGHLCARIQLQPTPPLRFDKTSRRMISNPILCAICAASVHCYNLMHQSRFFQSHERCRKVFPLVQRGYDDGKLHI